MKPVQSARYFQARTSGGKLTIGRFSVPDSPESGDRALLRDKECVIQRGEISISMARPFVEVAEVKKHVC